MKEPRATVALGLGIHHGIGIDQHYGFYSRHYMISISA